jgi:hypothetical protein
MQTENGPLATGVRAVYQNTEYPSTLPGRFDIFPVLAAALATRLSES